MPDTIPTDARAWMEFPLWADNPSLSGLIPHITICIPFLPFVLFLHDSQCLSSSAFQPTVRPSVMIMTAWTGDDDVLYRVILLRLPLVDVRPVEHDVAKPRAAYLALAVDRVRLRIPAEPETACSLT
jgi:hypothetical protein